MSGRKRSRGMEMLRASGVSLPAIKERPEEGTCVTPVPDAATAPVEPPTSQLRAGAQASVGSPGNLSKRVAALPDQLRLLSRVWGGWVDQGGGWVWGVRGVGLGGLGRKQ